MSESSNPLDELLNDPMIQLVMERDRVRPAELRLLLEKARARAADDSRFDQPVLPPAHIVARSCLKQWLYR
ncbi:hypothetical protein EOA60_24220 [Mesorhizobium sp. M1A.F.Ca.IN.020.06.1.1]|uniref:hypothetical protein n=1 Tax=unclassified Mesorhizobium TaxID=325217 RepID=UPI000BAF035F|nr:MULTISPECIES: hypothetical protein [unclassified Mesorhizobium]PBB31025.1 hypothetical protein CK214_18525 [Mesorhizobium sp. WSM3882]RUV00938.1 hypothetical protein EOA79_19745 [Mesorhizobium sp. M1A.F.Ca.IN.020.03.2.1]RUW06840.1 hypothetical protein EOA46_25070 [Mesorhizobium sp. M1A.F.Ca.IN.022.05.2.1]RUW21526.1 hypothetical protein EOA60_24220 [Mesorhizobium sp. M1A.F.Ca.IN.020.06.1.1]RWF77568.1 MAG: hypothetical protein EOQ35_24595 [Mesorhizobium sp.]